LTRPDGWERARIREKWVYRSTRRARIWRMARRWRDSPEWRGFSRWRARFIAAKRAERDFA